MNQELLNQLIADKYINVQKHPDADLFIYNYSQKVQFERLWNEITLICRGLIMDENKTIIARPFPKFFNLEEIPTSDIPSSSFDVFEKMDGSLGILYWVNGQPAIATRGSFTSDQAIFATKLLREKYAESITKLDKSATYLFEIIYPENRIVLDYGDSRELVLLAILDTQSGNDLELVDIEFPIVKSYNGVQNFEELKQRNESNKEGYVIRFQNNLRLKIKFEEYLRLHRIVTEISNKDIWEYLKEDLSFEEILDRVPDEFYQWVKLTKSNLETEFKAIETIAKSEFKTLETRKETALYFMTCSYPSILFLMLDGKNYNREIWKLIKPEFEKPFANKEVN